MAEKIVEKNKIKFVPLPEKVVKRVGLHSNSYVEVSDDGYHIILTPVEEDFTKDEWQKIVALKKDKGKTFKSGKAFIKHLHGLIRK